MSQPTIDQILTSLKGEVMLGRAYLTVANDLKDGDSVVIGTAPTFFGLMLQSSLDSSLLFAAKLYDKTKGAITVKSLLHEAKTKAGTFKNGTSAQVFLAVKNSTDRITGIEAILNAVQKRRNEALAHLDAETVTNPAGLDTSAKLTLSDLETVFNETSAILNEILCLWAGTYAYLEFIGDDDYTNALDLIAQAKHAQVDRWEAEFPDQPCQFPRPKTPRLSW